MSSESASNQSHAPEASDEELMLAYRAGDEAAFRELFRRYAPRLLRAVRMSAISDDDARDLLQQTFLQLHRARNDFQRGRRLRPWIYTIALNLKRDLLRRRGRRVEIALEPEQFERPATQNDALERRAEAQQLRAALQQLPDAQREVIELHWFAELPFSEIAQSVGAGLSTVKVRAHRGYKRLRALLEQQDAGAGRSGPLETKGSRKP